MTEHLDDLAHLAWRPLAAVWTAAAVFGICVGVVIDHYTKGRS